MNIELKANSNYDEYLALIELVIEANPAIERYVRPTLKVEIKEKCSSRIRRAGTCYPGRPHIIIYLPQIEEANNEYKLNRSTLESALSVLAHELGHIVWYKNGMIGTKKMQEKFCDDFAEEILGYRIWNSYSAGKYWED